MEDVLSEELNRFKEFMEGSAKDDSWNYQLFTLPFANTKTDRKYYRYENFDSSTPEESLELLENAIRLHGDRAYKFFLVRHMKNKNDSQKVDYTLKNPFYDESVFKTNNSSASISGFSQNAKNSSMEVMMMMMQQQQQHFKQIQEKDKEIRDEREDRKLERMEDMLQALKADQATTVDKIGGFLESETGQKIVTGIMSLVQNSKIANDPNLSNNMLLTKEKSPSLQKSETKQEENNGGTPQEDQQQKIQKYTTEAIHKMSEVFGDETLVVLYELGNYCEQNPIVAKQLREQIRPKK